MPRLFAISDIHIQGPDDPFFHSLLKIIRERVGSGDHLVLAGDIFDLYVGHKPVFQSRYAEFFEALRTAGGRGTRIHYIEGNHDFLIQRAFSGIPGLTVHPEQVTFEIEGKRFFIAHGDKVDRRDYGYRALRAFFRSPVMKSLVRVVPGEWLDRIGHASSDASRRSNKKKYEKRAVIPPPMNAARKLPATLDRIDYLRKTFRSYAAERLSQGFDFVILGHCHDLDEKCFKIDGRHGQYINVGFPRVHRSMLTWSPGDERIQRERLP